jgi:nucleoside-diphosphate-sugar epimerase
VTYERILVTGASGFVGCRLVEWLHLGLGAQVRAGIHRTESAARLARLDVERVHLDLADRDSLARALDGCDAVVHCAYGTTGSGGERKALTGEATGTLAELAHAAGVKRFVHLSSVAVWGFDPGARTLDETVAAEPSSDPYCGGKQASEAALGAVAARGLATVVLRPTNVYGPYSGAFTAGPVRALAAGDVALVGDGAAPANLVYVDNLVAAIVAALERDEAVGETFVISDAEQPSWRELLEAYAGLLDPSPDVVALSEKEYRQRRKAQRLGVPSFVRDLRAVAGSPELRSVAAVAAAQPTLRRMGAKVAGLVPGGRERFMPKGGTPSATGPAPHQPALPSPELAALQTSGVRYNTSKAQRLLAYESPADLERGLALTADWLRFSRLV